MNRNHLNDHFTLELKRSVYRCLKTEHSISLPLINFSRIIFMSNSKASIAFELLFISNLTYSNRGTHICRLDKAVNLILSGFFKTNLFAKFTVINLPIGIPASRKSLFITSLSIPTADPPPAPTNGMFASLSIPCTVPSSPNGPCITGKITSKPFTTSNLNFPSCLFLWE